MPKTFEMTETQMDSFEALLTSFVNGIMEFTDANRGDMNFIMQGSLNALVRQTRATCKAAADVTGADAMDVLQQVSTMLLVAEEDYQNMAVHGTEIPN